MNSLRVLLVDTDSEKSEAISTALSNANHIVVPTTGLDEAGEALFVEQVDAVLLASRFSAASLAEFNSKLRRVEASQKSALRIPVLALAPSSGNAPSPGEGPGQGYDGLLQEPLDPNGLTDAVRNLAKALNKPVERKAASVADNLPVLEPDKFDEQVGYDNELMVEIIDLFLDEGKKQVTEMEDCVNTGNWDSLSKLAHTIKGSLGSLHATRAKARAQELEMAARGNQGDTCPTLFHQLVHDLQLLEPELTELRNERS